jgi:hypothetical protein
MVTAKNVRALIIAFLATALFSLCVQSVAAQGTARITGKVVDQKTGKPLGYANIVIVGTTMGAMSMADGNYTVPVVPAGTYTIKVMMMGYKTEEHPNVTVNSGSTTELNFSLEETIVMKTEKIVVTGERPMVQVTTSDQSTQITDSQVKEMPVEDVVEAVALTSGVVKTGDELHVRGGRSGEVQMQIDGVPVDDPLGGSSIDVGMLGASEMEIISGGMDAEYGNAQSAIINITTKEGGRTFGGELRYFTDDFGRADKTYTNYDKLSLGFGGPTVWKSLRYYVSGEATFTDGENTTIEPRTEHKITDWLKYTDRQSTDYNLQTKLTLTKSRIKLSGEGIYSYGKHDTYYNNWNISGYVQKVYYFQGLRSTQIPGIYTFAGPVVVYYGPWVDHPEKLHPRKVEIRQQIRDENGQAVWISKFQFRAVDFGDRTVVWDEEIPSADGETVLYYKPWVLFEGYQYPYSKFSNTQEDSSYVYFNSATRTPETTDRNLNLKLSFNHNISSNLLYSINLSRLEFNHDYKVGDKTPAEYSSAGLPVYLPDGTYREGGITQAYWYTDPDHPYFVTAYDLPLYTQRRTVQYLMKADLTSKQFKGHRIKSGVQALYNDLNEDTRVFPAQTRRNQTNGTVQQGLNVNIFHNFNTEGAFYTQDKWEYEGMVLNAGIRLEFFSTGNNDKIFIRSAEVDTTVEQYKFNWSPRLGFAFPITDRDKFFFHYGRFTQWPSRIYLFRTQDAIGATGTLGNPNLAPELTISYQAGVSHQFSEDIAGNFVVFNKDIFGLVSSARVTDDSTGIQSFRFINKTYASSRGLEISLTKRLVKHVGFELYYTYSFADGVASDADFGRSAEGLTHLPTEELPLDWDQRHTFNVTFRLQDRNNWGATMIYQYGSGIPWTPVDRYARLQDPTWENSRRLESTNDLRVQGRKRFNVYGQELTLFFEGRNLLNEDILLPGGTSPGVFPGMVNTGMDGGSYLTETGQYGGAYLKDIDDDGLDEFIAVHDPTIWQTHRIWRLGFGFEF